MLRREYLFKKLTAPIPTKDGGTLCTIQEACKYMAAIGKERELRRHWRQVRELILQEADAAAVSWQLGLAVLKDAKLNVAALERMRAHEPPPGLLQKTNHQQNQQKTVSDPAATAGLRLR